jgi:uncharacterized protein
MKFFSRAFRALLLFLISGYRRLVSPMLPPACRFYPTCSEYALQAIDEHGPGRGTVLAVKRVCRCHPWSAGGVDPVPPSHIDSRTPGASSVALKEIR